MLGEKSLSILRIAAAPITSEARRELYERAAARWSDKAVQTKFYALARKGLIDYGVSARTGWLTDAGREALKASDRQATDPSNEADLKPPRS